MPTALIVEDEPEANKLLAMLVKLRGFQTVSAFTGNDALEQAAACKPDVVFLDLMLPDINGYEVCRILKSRQPTSAIPVVIVTARVAADNRLESFSNGADDYIPKPYTPDQIFESLASATKWKRDLVLPRAEGQILLEHLGADSLRQLARLRSLVLARTPLGFPAVERIFDEIQRVRTFASQWGCGGQGQAGSSIVLRYVIDPHNLTFEIHGESDWIAAFDAQKSQEIAAAIEPNPSGFRRPDASNDRLILTLELDPR